MGVIQYIGERLGLRAKHKMPNNMFGSIAGNGLLPFGTNMDFIPEDDQGNVIDISGKGAGSPKWIGLSNKSMQKWAYHYCSPLAAVVDRLAQADTNGIVEFLNQDGTTVKNETVNRVPSLSRVKELLQSPNPWQTWHNFNSQQDVICKLHGYCVVFAVGGLYDKTMSSALINISPVDCTPVKNEEVDIYNRDSKGPILGFDITLFGEKKFIPIEDCLIIKDGYLQTDEFGLPISKVAGLDYYVSNICAAMEADNVLLKKKGPLGFISHEAKPDPAGITPLTKPRKDELQKDLEQYGLTWSQMLYVISRYPARWNPMSYNVEELGTKNTIRLAIDGICDRLDYPAELMSGKNATYENRSSAERFLYQNNIIPFSLRKMAEYNRFFKLGQYTLTMDFDHLAVLQEDILKAGQARKENSTSIDIDWKAGRITWNESRVLMNMDTVKGMDIYYHDYIKLHPEMAQIQKPNNNGNSQKDPGTQK